jgi:hypothetical protein
LPKQPAACNTVSAGAAKNLPLAQAGFSFKGIAFSVIAMKVP